MMTHDLIVMMWLFYVLEYYSLHPLLLLFLVFPVAELLGKIETFLIMSILPNILDNASICTKLVS